MLVSEHKYGTLLASNQWWIYGGDGAITPTFKKHFSIFRSKIERKNKFTRSRMASINDFNLKSPLPLQKSPKLTTGARRVQDF
jgi:hypothetical protein